MCLIDDSSMWLFWFGPQIADLVNEDTPQIYTLCGRGPRSTLRVLRHGLEVQCCCTLVDQCCSLVFGGPGLTETGSTPALESQ